MDRHAEKYLRQADQFRRQAIVNEAKAEIAEYNANHVAGRNLLSFQYGSAADKAADNIYILEAALLASPHLQRYLEHAGRVNLLRKGVVFTDSRVALTKDGVVFQNVRGSQTPRDIPLTGSYENNATVRDLVSHPLPNTALAVFSFP